MPALREEYTFVIFGLSVFFFTLSFWPTVTYKKSTRAWFVFSTFMMTALLIMIFVISVIILGANPSYIVLLSGGVLYLLSILGLIISG